MGKLGTCKEEERDLFHVFRYADHMLHRVMERKLAKTGIYRGQHYMLMFLSKHVEMPQTEIAAYMGISNAAVAVALKKLEKAGYIQKHVDTEDNRKNQVEITTQGMEVVELSKTIMQETQESVLRRFTVEELSDFINYLERMYKILEEIGGYVVDKDCTE